MSNPKVSLNDKFDLSATQVLLNGTQALVRLMIMQKALDSAAGLNTAGLVTGYRGSPLGAVDMQMQRAAKPLAEADIVFQAGLNEDLAATALWGAQQAELRGEGKYDGVFGLWYGKGPGVDRSGDVLRHANMAGTSAHGGVVLAMGDDHTGESSTVLHQSELAVMDAGMPILSPAGVQEIIDYGLYGFALSRFSGLWVGLKTMKDTVEATAVVRADLHRYAFTRPELALPESLNIRLLDSPHAQEARLVDLKRFAAQAFARANKMDQRKWGKPGAKIGIVAAGKNWLDVLHAMRLLNIDEQMAERIGLTLYKVGQVSPLDLQSLQDWAEGLDLIVIVEEKRKVVEGQIKEALFGDQKGRRVYGQYKGGFGSLGREELFPIRGALDPYDIAEKLGKILCEEGLESEAILSGLAAVQSSNVKENVPELATRIPYFCSGCPHNSSTKIPDGSRAYAGIGCHYMVQWMERDTLGFTHMGAEGANWIGEAPFSKRDHVFQNIGDGTYNHSGIQAIRAAVAAGTTMTYKILYNDAVAMTGGQGNDGGLSAYRIAEEVKAMGVKHLAVVYDEKEDIDFAKFPKGLQTYERADLQKVQEEFAKTPGVSVIVYVQTCAAEKRRRRKRGAFPAAPERVFINPDICEGCGDCGLQSNCVAITPLETELGRKREIDQSSCNMDYSCTKGFCPSFVTLSGATLKKPQLAEIPLQDLPAPELPVIDGTWNFIVTGVGGTGVVTIGAVLAQAAQIDGKAAAMMEMAGLAQKGGAVHIHCRIAQSPEDISAVRVARGEADALIGGDLVVSAGAKTLELTSKERTGAVVNGHEITTGDFTRNREFTIPSSDLQDVLHSRLPGAARIFDASELARLTLGDSIFSNMILFGAAWQSGLIPVSAESISEAVTLNGAAPEKNLRAFEIGRWAVAFPEKAEKLLASSIVQLPKTLNERITYRAEHLAKYQSKRLAKRYTRLLDKIEDETLKEAVALGYHKLLSYKDEYEVARLHLQTRSKLADLFEGDYELSYHLAPPGLTSKDAQGQLKKRRYGKAVEYGFAMLARMKWLRGTIFDPFGYAAERKMERALIAQYEKDLRGVLQNLTLENCGVAAKFAKLPMNIKGFGHVKQASVAEFAKLREAALAEFRATTGAVKTAAQ